MVLKNNAAIGKYLLRLLGCERPLIDMQMWRDLNRLSRAGFPPAGRGSLGKIDESICPEPKITFVL